MLRHRFLRIAAAGLPILLLMICSSSVALAQSPAGAERQLQIQGKISVKGNDPHTYLCLSTAAGKDYRLEGALRDLIWTRYQQEIIRLDGKITKEALGPGAPAVFEVREILDPLR